MTKQERDKLRELAKAATPGEWRAFKDINNPAICITAQPENISDDECEPLAEIYCYEDAQDLANGRFIAAANPIAIFALLDYIDQLEQPHIENGTVTIPIRVDWLLEGKPKGFIDWGCKECAPDSSLAKGNFQCYYHRAEAAQLEQLAFIGGKV